MQNTCQHVTVIQIGGAHVVVKCLCSVVDRARVSTRDGFKLVATICNPVSILHEYNTCSTTYSSSSLANSDFTLPGMAEAAAFSSQLAPFPNEKRSNNNGIYKYILVTDHQISLLVATERIQRLVQ